MSDHSKEQPETEIQVQVIRPGAKRTYGGLRGRREAVVGKIFQVYVDHHCVGTVEYRLITRERRTPGRTYVDMRWESPGWYAASDRLDKGAEYATKADAVEALIRYYKAAS